ncbi:hypothetical protein F4803DRAFT_577935 [Xylaria telfairii]|nr:hypothetical protein F4803DRAFT_577935 [Xylaria telfairii]
MSDPQMINQQKTPLQNEAEARTGEWISRYKCYFKAWRDVGIREETALRKEMSRAMINPNISPRDKILLQLRTEAEGRIRQYASSACPCTIDFPSGRPPCYAGPRAAIGCLNTTTALYIFDGRQQFPYDRARDLEIWLWRKRFKPYTTDIELDRSFVQIFAVEYETLDVRVGSLISLHCRVWLSAPICFDEIRDYSIGKSGSRIITTTLDVATGFILQLEQREIDAVGMQPDICHPEADDIVDDAHKYRKSAEILGWDEERDGLLKDLNLKSSRWLDPTLFPKWVGEGAKQTMRRTKEAIQSKRLAEQGYTEDWWWDPKDLPESPTGDVDACNRITVWPLLLLVSSHLIGQLAGPAAGLLGLGLGPLRT